MLTELLLAAGANHNHEAHGFDWSNTKVKKSVRERAQHKDEHHILPLLESHIARLNQRQGEL